MLKKKKKEKKNTFIPCQMWILYIPVISFPCEMWIFIYSLQDVDSPRDVFKLIPCQMWILNIPHKMLIPRGMCF